MAFRYPSGSNVYVPNFEKGGKITSYTRDPKKFRLPDYVEYVPTKKSVGFYLQLDPDQPSRVVSDSDFVWPLGNDAPTGEDNLANFQFVQYATVRRAYAWRLPYEAVNDADWAVDVQHMGVVMTQAMTNRTIQVANLLQSSSNWPTTNIADVSTLNGGAGKWTTASSDPASPNYLAIKRAIEPACDAILLNTNAVVEYGDMRLLVSPTLARLMSCTSEIHDYLKGSPYSMPYLQNLADEGRQQAFGLPPNLYGLKVLVEQTVKKTNRPGAAVAASYAFGTTNPVIVSRPGQLIGFDQAPSFSTVQLYLKEEMTTEEMNDPNNRRVAGRCVDEFIPVATAFLAGYSLTNAV
jgi:hypothetical protein